MKRPQWCLIAGLFLIGSASAGTGDETGTVTGTILLKSRYREVPTLVYIDEISGKNFDPPQEHLLCDQKNKTFLPRVVPLLVGSTVEFRNSDDFEHNVKSPDQETFDLGNWGLDQKRSYTFQRPGVYTLLCSLHPEMVGYVVAVRSPHFVFAKDEEGKDPSFRLEGVPAGTWKVRIWNERLSPKKLAKTYEVAVAPCKETDLSIKP